MVQESHREVAFSEIEEDRLPEGKPISRLAVVSLLLGVVSTAALVAPVGGLFSLAAVVLGIAALRGIAGSEVPLLGRKAAILGLTLGLFFGAWGLVRDNLHQRLVTARARECADDWLEMLRTKRLYEAHQMLLSRNARQSPEKSLAQYYSENEEASQNFRDFTRQSPLRSILEAGDSAEFDFEGPVSVEAYATPGVREDIVRLRYLLRAADGPSAAQGLPFLLKMVRTRIQGESEAAWRVDGIQAPKDGPT